MHLGASVFIIIGIKNNLVAILALGILVESYNTIQLSLFCFNFKGQQMLLHYSPWKLFPSL